MASSKVLCSILPTPSCCRDGEEHCCRLVVDSHIGVAGKQAVGTVAADIVVAHKQVVGTVAEAAGTEVVDIVVADTAAAEEQIGQQLREPHWPFAIQACLHTTPVCRESTHWLIAVPMETDLNVDYFCQENTVP